MNKNNLNKGFSIVELSIVLVIIGIIMGIIVKGKSFIRTANINRDLAKIKLLQTEVNTYYSIHNGTPPLLDMGKYTIVEPSFYEQVSFKDLKLLSSEKTLYFNIIGCVVKEPGPILFLNTPRAEAQICISIAIDERMTSNSTHFPLQLSCYVERILDDRNLNQGMGRCTHNQTSPPGYDCNDNFKVPDYDNCIWEKGSQRYSIKAFN